MATVIIPTDLATTTTLFFSQTTTLDGVPYLLTFRFNSREQCYYLQIASADGTTTYAQGIKLVSNYPLLRGYMTPPGEMMAVSLSGNDAPAGLGELGDGQRVELMYVEAADVYASSSEPERNPGPFVT